MDKDKLLSWLRDPLNPADERLTDCPDDHLLAAYVDQQLIGEPGNQIALHLSDCTYCMAQVSLLKRLHDSRPEQSVNELVLARANRINKNSKRPAFTYVSRWATAAVIILAVTVVFRWGTQDQDISSLGNMPDSGQDPQAVEQRLTRNINQDILEPQILTPSNGSTVEVDALKFTWSEVSGSLYYDVRIVSDAGDLIWETQAEGTELELPGYLQLQPATEYYFRVDAHLASAKRISSQHVLFSIGEQH